MIKLFISFLKNKYFAIWVVFFIAILYFAYNPILHFKSIYMEENSISDVTFIFYVFLLPMSFYEMGFVTCLVLDLCFVSILSYIIVNFVNYFFVDSVSTTLTRVNRVKWIKNIFFINFIFSFIVSLLYIIFFLILCYSKGLSLTFGLDSLIIIIIYKILITIIIPNVYLLFYIRTNSPIISLGFLNAIYIMFELIIKMTFVES